MPGHIYDLFCEPDNVQPLIAHHIPPQGFISPDPSTKDEGETKGEDRDPQNGDNEQSVDGDELLAGRR